MAMVTVVKSPTVVVMVLLMSEVPTMPFSKAVAVVLVTVSPVVSVSPLVMTMPTVVVADLVVAAFVLANFVVAIFVLTIFVLMSPLMTNFVLSVVV